MTVQPVVPNTTYTLAAANLGPFETVWPYEIAADVLVYLDRNDGDGRILLHAGPDYVLTGAVDTLAGGGSVTVDDSLLTDGAWPTGATLLLQRATAQDQPSAFGEAAPFSPETAEAALDHEERQIQDLVARLAVQGAGAFGGVLVYPVGIELLDEGSPADGDWIGGDAPGMRVTWPGNLSAARIEVFDAGDGDTTFSLRKGATARDASSGTEVATLTLHDDKTFEFATPAGAQFTTDITDPLDWFLTSDTTASGFKIKWFGYVAADGSGAYVDVVTRGDLAAAVATAMDAVLAPAIETAVAEAVALATTVPIGTVTMRYTEDEPTGWKILNGQTIDLTVFVAFAEYLSSGDPTHTFPDLTASGGYFPRMWNGTDDYLRLQGDTFQSHAHVVTLNINPADAGQLALEEHDSAATTTTITSGAPVTDGVNGAPRTGAETRPKNFAINFLVKVV